MGISALGFNNSNKHTDNKPTQRTSPICNVNNKQRKQARQRAVAQAQRVSTTMPAKRRSTEHASATYQRNRKLILSDNPPCHWCGINAASEADHLIETDRGGTSELDNLVPACRKCNATRGNKYRAARDDQHARPKQKAKVMPANPMPATVSQTEHSQRFFTEQTP